ncbi:MAG: hypothetical protein L0Y80_12640 [Ignavibacteriae bacterium]|nr:hypothetical protein [Ignavibacteriota bacterium]
MRTVIYTFVALLLAGSLSVAQLKSKIETPPPVSESMMKPGSSDYLLGLFDPSKFSMKHSFTMSYSSFGGEGLSLGVYTNSLMYQFSDKLDFQADVNVMSSPYSSFGNKNDFSRIFLGRAQLNYRPTDNMWLQIQYREVPAMYWLSGNRNPSFYYGIDRYGDLY